MQYAQNGSSFVKASISDVCGNVNNERQFYNWAGSPIITSAGSYLFDYGSNTWQIYSNPNGGATYSYAVSSGSASLSPTGSSCYVTTSDGATVCQTATNSCGSVSYCFDVPAGGGGYMRAVSPNPAKDQLTLQFTDTKSVESLPSDVYLYGENSTKAVRSISLKDVYDRKAFVDVDKLNVSVGDLPRGTYYLHVVPNKESNRPTQKIRIILE